MRTSVMVAIAVLTATCMLQIGSPLERPAFAADAVHFPTTADDHATLTGYLSHPNGSGPYPAVIFLPGCDGKLTDIDRVYDSVFAGQNYVVLSFDTHGSRHLGDTCGRSESVLSALTQAKDAISANVYLRTLSYVDPNRIVVIGWSWGGSAALVASAKALPPAVGAAAATFRTTAAFYPECGYLQRYSTSPRVPVLILVGTADDIAPPDKCESAAQAAASNGQPVTIKTYDDAEHGFDVLNGPPIFVKALNGHMAADPAAAAAARTDLMGFLSDNMK